MTMLNRLCLCLNMAAITVYLIHFLCWHRRTHRLKGSSYSCQIVLCMLWSPVRVNIALFGRNLLKGSQLTIGGLHTTDTKMPTKLLVDWRVHTCTWCTHTQTHTRTPITNTHTQRQQLPRELFLLLAGMIVFLLVSPQMWLGPRWN